MDNLPIGHSIVWLSKVDSTNRYAATHATQASSHGVVIATHDQTEGRGQGGNTWESQKNLNLTFSIIIHPKSLSPSKQFLLSKVVSIGLVDMLTSLTNRLVSIKWPNDICINNCKVAGILIENTICGTTLETSIVGVGLNVNQIQFPNDIPNPTSLAIETNRTFNLNDLLKDICSAIDLRYSQLCKGMANTISSEYFSALYRRNDFYPYMTKGQMFIARIHGVKDSGELQLETKEGEVIDFQFKEVQFARVTY